MANNFRTSGGGYISKDGNDANDGLTEDTPKASITASFSASPYVIGSGHYFGAYNLTGRVFADGYVKIKLTANGTTGNTAFFNDIGENSFIEFDLNGFNLASGNFSSIYYVEFNRTILKNGTVSGRYRLFKESIMRDVSLTSGTGAGHNFENSKFFNSVLPDTVVSMIDCYLDSASSLDCGTTYFTTPATQFTNNNFRGILTLNGVNYELKRDKAGNAIDPNPTVLDIISIDPTVYDRGNFSQDPEFLNIEKGDYWSVSETSPLLFASSSGRNIGDVEVANSKKVTDLEFSSGTITDLVLSGGDFVIDGVATTGVVISQPIQVAPIPQVLGRVNISQALNFNSDEVLGSGENNNVVIVDNYTTGTAGANPRRLTFEMRWSNSDTVPLVDADWDNQLYITEGDFGKFEHFEVPRIDASGLGNGEPTFVLSSSAKLRAKWVQFKFTLLRGIG